MHFSKYKKGFTLVELLVAIVIFAGMTAFLALKYGDFSKGTIVTNTAYDIALMVRQAQSYGINVRDSLYNSAPASFDYPYGISFYNDTSSANVDLVRIFVDLNKNNTLDGNNEIVRSVKLKKSIDLSSVCTGSQSHCQEREDKSVDILFKRPSPEPIIYVYGSSNPYDYAKVTFSSVGGANKKNIVIRSTGQISVED